MDEVRHYNRSESTRAIVSSYRPLWSTAKQAVEFTETGAEKTDRRADREADLVEAAIPKPRKL